MDFLDDLPLTVALPVLALVDGLSIGTLLIPLFLLLAPGRPAVGRVMLYLATITGFYAVIGVLLSLGIITGLNAGADFLGSTGGAVLRLIVGVALVVVAFSLPGGRKPKDASAATPTAARAESHAGDGAGAATVSTEIAAGTRIARWRDRLLAPRVGAAAVMAVALAAGLLEVATMLPYLAAMSILSTAALPPVPHLLVIVGYCLVMILPAIVLLVVRILARDRVDRGLRALAAWVYRMSSGETMAWLLGIIGFLIARGAAQQLGLFHDLSSLFGG